MLADFLHEAPFLRKPIRKFRESDHGAISTDSPCRSTESVEKVVSRKLYGCLTNGKYAVPVTQMPLGKRLNVPLEVGREQPMLPLSRINPYQEQSN
jgi:hypothetical protein